MFGVGFFEILVIAVLGLLVFGPEKLPEAIRTFAFGFSKAKRSWQNTRRELEQELGMDEIRREIHNAQMMENLEKNKTPTHNQLEEVKSTTDEEADLGEHIDNHETTNQTTISNQASPETPSESGNSDQEPKTNTPEEK